MLSYFSPEQRVPTEHPLRPLRAERDDILKELSPRLAKLYAENLSPMTRTTKILTLPCALLHWPGRNFPVNARPQSSGIEF